MNNKNLAMMSVDQLWSLHEQVCAILSTKLSDEKRELERRLVLLNGRAEDKPKAQSEAWGSMVLTPHGSNVAPNCV